MYEDTVEFSHVAVRCTWQLSLYVYSIGAPCPPQNIYYCYGVESEDRA